MESAKEEDETAADLTPSEKDALQKQARSTVLGKALLQSHLLSYLSSGEEEEESSRVTLLNVLVYKLQRKRSQQMRGKVLCLTRSGAATVAPLLQAGGRALAP